MFHNDKEVADPLERWHNPESVCAQNVASKCVKVMKTDCCFTIQWNNT